MFPEGQLEGEAGEADLLRMAPVPRRFVGAGGPIHLKERIARVVVAEMPPELPLSSRSATATQAQLEHLDFVSG